MHSFTHSIALDFGRVIVFASTRIRTWRHNCNRWQCHSTGRQKRLELHRGEFLHNFYTFESVHNSDHDGAVRIFVGLSC